MSDDVLSITGDGPINTAPWSDYSKSITSVTIADGATSIEEEQFKNCSAITSIIIPNTVSQISGEAFYNCYALSSVTLPNGLTGLYGAPFSGCLSLKTVTVTGRDSDTTLLKGDLGTKWKLPGLDDYLIGTININTEGNVGASIEPKVGKNLCIAPGTTVVNSVTESLSEGTVYISSSTSFVPTAAYVTFDSNGGIPMPDMQIVDIGGMISEPVVAKTGYRFNGWYAGDNKWDFDTQLVSGYTRLVAHWDENTCVVTFDANGGSTPIATKTVACGGTYGELPTPTKSGFSFKGWFTELSGGSLVESNTTVENASDHTLYAHWTAQQHNSRSNINETEKTNDANTTFMLSIFGVVISLVAVVVIIQRR